MSISSNIEWEINNQADTLANGSKIFHGGLAAAEHDILEIISQVKAKEQDSAHLVHNLQWVRGELERIGSTATNPLLSIVGYLRMLAKDAAE